MPFNRERTLGLMRQHGIHAIVGTTPENVTYLAGFVGWSHKAYFTQQIYALLAADSPETPALIINRQEMTYLSAYGPRLGDVYIHGGVGGLALPEDYEPKDEEQQYFARLARDKSRLLPSPGACLVRALKDKGIARGKVGVDEERCAAATWETLRRELPGVEFVPASKLFLMIRFVKTEEELERLRAAARVNEGAIEAVFRAIRPGVSEEEVAAVYRENVARPGGMWAWFHFASGPRASTIFPPTGRKLVKRDPFFFDAGLFLKNYNADTGSCGCLGDPSPRLHKIWKAIETGFHDALSVIRKGATGSQVFGRLVESVRKNGLPQFNGVFCGHTVGLEAREFPYVLAAPTKYNEPFLPPTSDLPFEVDTCLNIEAPYGEAGFGGVQIEYSVVVKENGWEPLIPQKRELRVIPA